MAKSIFDGAHLCVVEALINARKRSGLTQAEVAAKIGRDQTVISTIERSQRRIDILEFIALARAMNEDPVALFAEIAAAVPDEFDI